MNSIGEIIDKLIIENMKIFNMREKLHQENIADEEYVELDNKMNILNENRGVIIDCLNEKLDNVQAGKEKNVILRSIKTYAQ